MLRKAIKAGMIKTSGIAAAAVLVGVAASENPFAVHKAVAFCVSMVWIALLLIANRSGT